MNRRNRSALLASALTFVVCLLGVRIESALFIGGPATAHAQVVAQSSEAFGLQNGCIVRGVFVPIGGPCSDQTPLSECSYSQQRCQVVQGIGACVAGQFTETEGTICRQGSGCTPHSRCNGSGFCQSFADVRCPDNVVSEERCVNYTCNSIPGGPCIATTPPPVDAVCVENTGPKLCGEKYRVWYDQLSPRRCGGRACPAEVWLDGPECPKVPATCTGGQYTRTFGDPNPLFGYRCVDSSGADVTRRLARQGTLKTGPSSFAPAGVTYDVIFDEAPSDPGYTITTEPAKLTVTQRPVRCTIANVTRQFGQPNPASFGFSCTGFVGNDSTASIFGSIVPSTTAVASSAVGTYPITMVPPTTTNYEIRVDNGTLTVTEAPAVPVTCTGSIHTRGYGASNPTLSYSCIDGSGANVTARMTTQGTFQAGPTSTSTAGRTYDVPFDRAPAAFGYAVTTVPAKITVTKKPVTCTVASASRPYMQPNPSPFPFTCNGFLAPDSSASIFGTSAPGTIAVTSTAAGTYPITLAAPMTANYSITVVNGNLTITAPPPIPLTCTGSSHTRVFGTSNPTLSYTCIDNVGRDRTDKMSVGGTFKAGPSATSAAGQTYDVPFDQEPAEPGYIVTAVPAKITVTKKRVTCTVANASRQYGQPNPSSFPFTCNGFTGGDSTALVFGFRVPTTTAVMTSAAGSYPITLLAPTSTNYDIVVVNGTLSISPASLIPAVCTGSSHTRLYGAANPTFTYTCLDNTGRDITGKMSQGTFKSGPSVTSAAGRTYSVSFEQDPGEPGYSVTAHPATVTVTKRPVTCTVANASRKQGQPNPSPFAFSCTGFRSPDTTASIFGARAPTTAADASSPAGSYPITLDTFTTTNYELSITRGTLTVTPQCSPATVATDCPTDDGDACTVAACNEIGQCYHRPIGVSGSLNATMTLSCPNNLRIDFDDVLRCVDNNDSSALYRIGVDTDSAVGWLSNPGRLLDMNSTVVPRGACSQGRCTFSTSGIDAANFYDGMTFHAGVAAFADNSVKQQAQVSRTASCQRPVSDPCGGATCPSGTLNPVTCECDPACGNGRLDRGEECDRSAGLAGNCLGFACVNCRRDTSKSCASLFTEVCTGTGSMLSIAWGPNLTFNKGTSIYRCHADENCCPPTSPILNSQDQSAREICEPVPNSTYTHSYNIRDSCPQGAHLNPPPYEVSCTCGTGRTMQKCMDANTGSDGAEEYLGEMESP